MHGTWVHGNASWQSRSSSLFMGSSCLFCGEMIADRIQTDQWPPQRDAWQCRACLCMYMHAQSTCHGNDLDAYSCQGHDIIHSSALRTRSSLRTNCLQGVTHPYVLFGTVGVVMLQLMQLGFLVRFVSLAAYSQSSGWSENGQVKGVAEVPPNLSRGPTNSDYIWPLTRSGLCC